MYKKQDLHDGIKSSLGRVQVTRDLSPLHFLRKAGGVRAKHNKGLVMTNTGVVDPNPDPHGSALI